MNESSAPAKLWNKGFILLFIANLFMHMGQQTISTLVPKYAASMGAAATIVGIASSAFAISALLSKPFTSPAFSCVNKRNLFILSAVIYLAAYVVFYIAPSPEWLIAGRLLQGIGTGIAAPVSLSLACDNITEGSFSKGVSMFSLGQAFGQAVGPSVGLSLSKSIGYKMTFVICFFAMVLAIIAALFVKGKQPEKGAKYLIRFDTIIEKKAVPPAITLGFVVMAYACIPGFLAIYGDLLGIDKIGLYFTVYAIAILVLRFVTGGLADKFGYRTVVSISLVCFAVTFILFAFSRSLTGFIIAAIFSALGYGITLPNMQALCMSSISPDRRGVASNTMYLFQDIGQSVGPWLAGMLIDGLILSKAATSLSEAPDDVKISAYSTMFLCVIVFIVIALALMFLITRKKK